MSRMIHNKEVIARKDHPEMSSEWFSNDMSNLSDLGYFLRIQGYCKIKGK